MKKQEKIINPTSKKLLKPFQEPFLVLHKNLEDTISKGHPWIYQDALKPHRILSPGTVVILQNQKGEFLGRGLYDPHSPIAVRIYTNQIDQFLNQAFLQKRLNQALSLRKQMLPLQEMTAFRLCHGEGDQLPGLVIDIYEQTAVVQFDGEAAQLFWKSWISSFLRELPLPIPLQSIYYKRRPQAGEPSGEILWGNPLQEQTIKEHGASFWVDVGHGQKTGFFLDQRENRALIRSYCQQKRVWNGFSYTGGFSVQAALGGAKRVVSVDIAKGAIETAKRNFTLNQISLEPHAFFAEDVFTHLRQAIASKIKYDFVIVDPPSFAPSEKSLPKALHAYQDLYTLAFQITEPDGLLVASSCSSHVTQEAFLQMLGESAYHANKSLQIIDIRSQPIDHPSLPAFPEGRYLKFVLLRVKA